MAEWFEKTEGFTERDKQFSLLAYRNTFCKDEDGRQVLCHLKTILEGFAGTDTGRLVARELLDIIFDNCGISNNMEIIKALSNVANNFNIPKKEEFEPLNA